MLLDEATLRKLERLSVMSRRALAGRTQGERRSPKRGQSVEFADYRPYSPGDDFRRIDWNAYARMERFFIKLFVEEEDQTVHLLVDASPSMNWGDPNKLAFALRAAAALGYIALAGLDRVTVTVFGLAGKRENGDAGSTAVFPPQRGKQSAVPLFTFLERFLPAQPSTSNFQPATFNLQLSTASPGPLILLSDLFEPPTPGAQPAPSSLQPLLSSLAARGFDVTILHILAPDELDPDLEGDLKLLDSESGAPVEITADYDLLTRYRRALAAWQAEWRAFCTPRGITYLPVTTPLPLDDLLFAWLRRYGVVG